MSSQDDELVGIRSVTPNPSDDRRLQPGVIEKGNLCEDTVRKIDK